MPLNLALVIDHSGSMKGAKLKNVKDAVKMVIDRLEPTDYLSVVIFDDLAVSQCEMDLLILISLQ
jgi:Ca-activated chloride channel homolog